MKLWQKDDHRESEESAAVNHFTVGNDREWDVILAEYDVVGSIAHAAMLEQVGIISAKESKALKDGLEKIREEIRAGVFHIEPQVEDVHSQVEKLLIERIGDAGKKLHTGRSRNDQILLDIKLFLRHELKGVAKSMLQLFNRLQELSEQHKNDLLPGYTHLQLAMPSSFGLWFGAYAESLTDDMEMLLAAYRIADKNPLGSGAGYGSAFPLQRKVTTHLLGFGDMNYNSVYAQMTRGKTEKATLTAFASVASTISKFAYDVCLYMNQQFGFVSFPDSLTTGSSIMPHKKNPDVFELLRARCSRLLSAPNEMTLLCNNLPSGYHRDMQLTKDILFPAVADIQECLSMMLYSLKHIQVRSDILNDSKFNDLFTVEEINKLVAGGMAFRDAYKAVGARLGEPGFNPSRSIAHTHEGSISNLGNAEIKARMDGLMKQLGVSL